MPEDDPPLPPAAVVVQLTDVIRSVYHPRECQHERLEVDDQNRRVTCIRCGREVEPFQALLIISRRSSEYQVRFDQMARDHRNLAAWVPHLRTVRQLEHMWRNKQLPLCPHCRKPVTAEGLNSHNWVHADYAAAATAASGAEFAAEVVPIKAKGPIDDAS